MNEPLRICKRCLLKDMEENEYYESVAQYVSLLDPNIKASPELYEKRLSICKTCDRLVSGICRSCGCFVEMRAAVEKNRCPSEEHLW